MSRRFISFVPLLFAASAVVADDSAHDANTAASANGSAAPQGDVTMSGMSILGNDEAPKSLVLVPWKSSQLGDMPTLSRLPDDSIKPVDKEVFSRELSYYQIRSDSK